MKKISLLVSSYCFVLAFLTSCQAKNNLFHLQGSEDKQLREAYETRNCSYRHYGNGSCEHCNCREFELDLLILPSGDTNLDEELLGMAMCRCGHSRHDHLNFIRNCMNCYCKEFRPISEKSEKCECGHPKKHHL